MEVSYDDRRLKALCESEKELRKVWGTVRAKKIQARIADLRAAETLADMQLLPGRCHELTHGWAGHLSVDLDHPYRLLFRPGPGIDPGPGGGLDWSKVTSVVIVCVTDTH